MPITTELTPEHTETLRNVIADAPLGFTLHLTDFQETGILTDAAKSELNLIDNMAQKGNWENRQAIRNLLLFVS